jgi:5-methyltetrahydrofolate--homocysteine methyltransferase
MDILKKIEKSVVQGKFQDTGSLVQIAFDEGQSSEVILNQGLFAGMDVVGELFKDEEVFIPDVLLAAKAMQSGIDVLAPVWQDVGKGELGNIVFGTVKGDIHNLGKKLVTVMLTGVGFNVIDIGENVLVEDFISKAIDEEAKIIAMSALLTTTMGYMGTVIEALEKNGMRGKVKTIIGGACVTQRFADEIGADGFAHNAGAAVEKAKEFIASPSA